jgi:hypothetical protein
MRSVEPGVHPGSRLLQVGAGEPEFEAGSGDDYLAACGSREPA